MLGIWHVLRINSSPSSSLLLKIMTAAMHEVFTATSYLQPLARENMNQKQQTGTSSCFSQRVKSKFWLCQMH